MSYQKLKVKGFLLPTLARSQGYKKKCRSNHSYLSKQKISFKTNYGYIIITKGLPCAQGSHQVRSGEGRYSLVSERKWGKSPNYFTKANTNG